MSHDMQKSLQSVEQSPTRARKTDDLTWLDSLMSITPRTWRDEATLPCTMIPPARSHPSRLFDRDDVMDRIQDHFNQPPQEAFRSIALYGMGGVGKTHVAMRYAQDQFTKGTVSAVLWIEGETDSKLKASFTHIARSLELTGYKPSSDDDNRLLVLQWLQQTSYVSPCIYSILMCSTDNAQRTQRPNGSLSMTTWNASKTYMLTGQAPRPGAML